MNKELLLEQIRSLSTDNEKFYVGLNEDIDDISAGSEISNWALNIVKAVLSGADNDTISGLKDRLDRLDAMTNQLKTIPADEEFDIILGAAKRVRTALLQHISQKTKIMKRAASAVGQNLSSLSRTVENAFSDNIFAVAAFSAGRKLMEARRARQQSRQEATSTKKGDLTSLYSTSLRQPDTEEPAGMSEDVSSAPEMDSALSQDVQSDSSDVGIARLERVDTTEAELAQDSFAEPGEAVQENTNKLVQIASDTNNNVVDITEALQRAAGNTNLREKTTTAILRIDRNLAQIADYYEEKEDQDDSDRMDALEAQLESQASSDVANLTPEPVAEKDSKKGGLLSGIFGSAGFSKILLSGMTSLVAGLGWAVVDGISGFLKSDEWGVSKISGFLGGFFGGTGDSQVMRAISNMGKWALIGAGIGSVVPVIGTAVGGLLGALIGGIMGWIGGQDIAVFFDDFGSWIKDSFTNGVAVLKNFFSDMWETAQNMTDSVLDTTDGIKLAILGWVKNTIDWLVSKDPTGLVEGRLSPLTEGMGEMQKGIENDMKRRADARAMRAKESGDNSSEEKNAQKVNKELRIGQSRQWRRAAARRRSAARAERREESANQELSTSPAPSAGGDAGAALRVKDSSGATKLMSEGGFTGQAFGGGKTHPGTIALARAIQSRLGGDLNRFTAFNDFYHKNRKSFHNKGLALDLTLNSGISGAKRAKAEIERIMKEAGARGLVLDEYKDPSPHATGGHIHVNFASDSDAERFLQSMSSKQEVASPQIPMGRSALDTSSSDKSKGAGAKIASSAPAASPAISPDTASSKAASPAYATVAEKSSQAAIQQSNTIQVNNVTQNTTNASGNNSKSPQAPIGTSSLRSTLVAANNI